MRLMRKSTGAGKRRENPWVLLSNHVRCRRLRRSRRFRKPRGAKPGPRQAADGLVGWKFAAPQPVILKERPFLPRMNDLNWRSPPAPSPMAQLGFQRAYTIQPRGYLIQPREIPIAAIGQFHVPLTASLSQTPPGGRRFADNKGLTAIRPSGRPNGRRPFSYFSAVESNPTSTCFFRFYCSVGRGSQRLPHTKYQEPSTRVSGNCHLPSASCFFFKDLFPLTP